MSRIPSLTAQAIAERKSWQYRAVEYTHANQSIIGALLVAVLGRYSNPPCFHPRGGKITKDGIVLALYKGRTDRQYRVERVYENVEEFTNAFRGLAAAIGMTDTEQKAMFDEVRKWIFKDDRAVSTLG